MLQQLQTIKAVAVTDEVGTNLEFYTRPAGGSLTKRMTIEGGGSTVLTGDLYSNNIILGDGEQIAWGASTDATIKWDGTNDELEIQSAADASEISLIAGSSSGWTSEIQIGGRSSAQGEGIFFKTRTVTALTIDGSQNSTFAGDVMPSGENLHDIGSAATRWEDIFGDQVYGRSIYVDDYIYHNGDTDTYFQFNTDEINIATGGSVRIIVTSTATHFTTALRAPNGVVATPSISFDSDPDTGMWRNGANVLAFSTAGENRLNINASGNVGINETDPAELLHVTGNAADYAVIRIESGSTTHGSELQLGDSTDADYGSIVQFASSAGEGGRMRFTAGGTETMNLRGGNVGIGSTSPTSKLSISGSQTAIDLTRGTAGDSKWGLSSDSTALYIAELSTGSTDYIMTLKETTGNVGIGTNSPDEKLQVKGNICINSESTSTADTDIDKIHFKKAHALGPAVALYTLGEIRSYTVGGYAGGMKFYTGKSTGGGGYTSTLAMTLDESQNATFAGKVYVNETGGESIVIANNGYYGSKDTSGTELRLLGINNGNTIYMGSIDGSSSVNIRSAGNDAISIDGSQNSNFTGIVTTDKIFVAKGQNLAHTCKFT